MASIIKKTIKGKVYYYYTESMRVDGKPKRVKQIYLGSAQTIIKKLETQKPTQPLHSEIEAFGDVCLIYDLAERLSLVEMIDQCLPKRNQGISLGVYVLIAAINRAVHPTAKKNIADWYSKTVLKNIVPVPKSGLSCQRFWDNMDSIKDENIVLFEETFLEAILEKYPIDTSRLIYDATNFFTFYASDTKSNLAKTGHSKENRSNLKIVGLSMMITPDFNLPLLYDVYPGNTHDSVEFNAMVTKMQDRYTKITGKPADITISFDRGNNDEDNIELLENGRIPFHYVGGLRLSQVDTLLEIPKTKYATLRDDYCKTKEKTKVYRTKMNLYSRELTVLVTFDPRLYKKHIHTHEENISKTQTELEALRQQLNKRAAQDVLKGKQMTKESVSNRLKKILSRDHMDKIFVTDIIVRDCPNRPLITFRLNKKASAEIIRKYFGKRAFFTSRHEWSNEEIVGTYNSAWHVEGVFRQLKDVDYLSVRPLFHWTDQKIKIHIFFCVLAYRLCCILNHELRSAGIEVSINKMLESLSEIKKVITVFGTNNSDILISLSKGNNVTEKILNLYDLRAKYLS